MANITKFNSRVIMKHDTEAAWNAATNFIPLEGEIIVYTDLNKMKIGNGVDKVSILPFSEVDLPLAKDGGNYAIIANDLENNATTADYAFASGTGTAAKGIASHAEGDHSEVVTGRGAHAEGYYTKASGHGAHAEGFGKTNDKNSATGIGAHTEGVYTKASGSGAHAEGQNTRAHVSFAHAEGYASQAAGEASHAEGNNTKAEGAYSHAGGYYTIAKIEAQTAIGKYNADEATALFIIGNGTSDSARKNAFTAGNDGTNHYISIGTEILTEEKLKSIKEGGAQIITWEDND